MWTHASKCMHTYMHVYRLCTYTGMYTPIYMHTYMHVYRPCTHALLCGCTTMTCVQATYIHTDMHTLSYGHAHICMCTGYIHTHGPTHTLVCGICMHTGFAYTYTNTLMCMHRFICTGYIHTCTDMNTHTHKLQTQATWHNIKQWVHIYICVCLYTD